MLRGTLEEAGQRHNVVSAFQDDYMLQWDTLYIQPCNRESHAEDAASDLWLQADSISWLQIKQQCAGKETGHTVLLGGEAVVSLQHL